MGSFTTTSVSNLAKDADLAAKENTADAHPTVPQVGT